MNITQLPIDPGPAAWDAILPERAAFPTLERSLRCDWLVIGGGFAGLSTAYRLQQLQPQASIVVVDACQIATGPAGRNSGFMIDLPHDLSSSNYGGTVEADRLQIRLNRSAIDFARDIAQRCELSEEAFAPIGKTNAAASAKGMKHNRDYAQHLMALGESFTELDASDMQALTGTHYYQGGLYTPGAAMLQPAMYIRGLAHGLVSGVHLANEGAAAVKPVQVYENSPITALTREGQHWQAKSHNATVSAGGVILAVNGHTQSFGFLPRQLMHVFTYASMTRALQADEIKRLGGQSTWALTPADPMGTTVRRVRGVGGDRIIVRNQFTYDPSMVVSQRRMQRVGQAHDVAFARRFPMLQGVPMSHRWGGRLCLSLNGVQACGELDNQLFVAAVQNGLGLTRGTLSGMMAANLACGVESSLVTAFLNQGKPKTLPPEPLAWVGINAAIKWKQMCAGREL